MKVLRRSALMLLASLAVPAAALGQSHGYTPQKPGHNETLDGGRLSTQVNFHSSRGPIFQWGFQLQRARYAAATGPMTEDADIYCNGRRVRGYHDHHLVWPSYLVHSHFKPLRTCCNYQLAVNERFPIRKGNRPGIRFVFLRYDFFISYA